MWFPPLDHRLVEAPASSSSSSNSHQSEPNSGPGRGASSHARMSDKMDRALSWSRNLPCPGSWQSRKFALRAQYVRHHSCLLLLLLLSGLQMAVSLPRLHQHLALSANPNLPCIHCRSSWTFYHICQSVLRPSLFFTSTPSPATHPGCRHMAGPSWSGPAPGCNGEIGKERGGKEEKRRRRRESHKHQHQHQCQHQHYNTQVSGLLSCWPKIPAGMTQRTWARSSAGVHCGWWPRTIGRLACSQPAAQWSRAPLSREKDLARGTTKKKAMNKVSTTFWKLWGMKAADQADRGPLQAQRIAERRPDAGKQGRARFAAQPPVCLPGRVRALPHRGGHLIPYENTSSQHSDLTLLPQRNSRG